MAIKITNPDVQSLPVNAEMAGGSFELYSGNERRFASTDGLLSNLAPFQNALNAMGWPISHLWVDSASSLDVLFRDRAGNALYRQSLQDSLRLLNPDNYSAKVLTQVAAGEEPGTPPAAISDLAVAVDGNVATLSWTANGGTISVYRRNTSIKGKFTLVAFGIAGDATSYTDSGLSPASTYEWRIRSSNEYGFSPPSNTATGTTEGAGTAPDAIADLTLDSIGETQAVLSWAPNGGTIALYRRAASGPLVLINDAISGAADTYTDTGLQADTQYEWQVTASNAYGTSALSNTVAGKTADGEAYPYMQTLQDKIGVWVENGGTWQPAVELPDAPAQITGLAASAPSTTTTLSWTPNGGNIEIFRRNVTAGGTFASIESGLSGTASMYYDAGLTPETQYEYYVVASNAGGNSPASATVSVTTGVLGDFVIPLANRFQAPLTTMEVIYPRPDIETQPNAYHRNAHSQYDHRVRICVRGGEWPYRMTLTTAPAGAQIVGQMDQSEDVATGKTLHSWADDMFWVVWPKNGRETGSQNFVVLIEDQAGRSVEATYSVAQDDTAYVIASESRGNDAGAGTYADPVKTFATGIWKNSDSDSTWGGKIAMFEDGTYPVNSGVEGPIVMSTTIKPIAFVGAPGAEAVFDMALGNVYTNATYCHDFLLQNMTVRNCRETNTNNRIFQIGTVSNRISVIGNTWDNISAGTVGNDNPTCFGFFDNTQIRQYIAVADNFLTPTVTTELTVTYACDHVLVENNRALNQTMVASNGDSFIHIKDDTSNVTVRSNVFKGYVTNYVIGCSNQISTGAQNQEICYNQIIAECSLGVQTLIQWNLQASSPNGENTHDYRNNCVVLVTGKAYRFVDGGGEPVLWSANAYHTVTAIDTSGRTIGTPANAVLSETDFDSEGALTGAARVANLGYVGSAIAGDAA